MADRRLVDNLNALVKHPAKPRERLPAVGSPGALPGRGTGKPGGVGSGTGIASPLTEPDYATRTFHAAVTLTTTDGVFTLEIEPLATIDLLDRNSNPVRIEYAAPPPP